MKFPAFWGVVCALAFFAQAQALVIDNFSDGATTLQATDLTGQTVVQTGLDAASVLGGERTIYVGSQAANVSTGASGAIDLAKKRFRFQSDPSEFGYFELRYGENTSLDLDLTTEGHDRFVLDLVDVTRGLYRGLFDIRLETGLPGQTVLSKASFSTELYALEGYGEISILFDAFANADFTKVQSIEISVGRYEAGFQMSLQSFTTAIPEPSSGLLLSAVGVVALSRRYRRSMVSG